MVLSFGYSFSIAFGDKGINGSVGVAASANGVALYQTSGHSQGVGVQIGVGGAVQKGSLEGMVAPTGQGGGRSANVTVAPRSVSYKFDDNNNFTGLGLGTGGPLAVSVDETTNGHAAVFHPIAAATGVAKRAYGRLEEAARPQTGAIDQFTKCPHGCR